MANNFLIPTKPRHPTQDKPFRDLVRASHLSRKAVCDGTGITPRQLARYMLPDNSRQHTKPPILALNALKIFLQNIE